MRGFYLSYASLLVIILITAAAIAKYSLPRNLSDDDEPTMNAMTHRFLCLGMCCALASCAPSTHVMVGQARPPITPDQVKIYSHPPTNYQEIAILDATSKSAFGPGGQKSMDKVIERLKLEASKLGANGVILEGFSDAETGSIGTGVGSDSYSGNSAVGVGVGGSLGIFKKTGHGDAIYVPPSPTN